MTDSCPFVVNDKIIIQYYTEGFDQPGPAFWVPAWANRDMAWVSRVEFRLTDGSLGAPKPYEKDGRFWLVPEGWDSLEGPQVKLRMTISGDPEYRFILECFRWDAIDKMPGVYYLTFAVTNIRSVRPLPRLPIVSNSTVIKEVLGMDSEDMERERMNLEAEIAKIREEREKAEVEKKELANARALEKAKAAQDKLEKTLPEIAKWVNEGAKFGGLDKLKYVPPDPKPTFVADYNALEAKIMEGMGVGDALEKPDPPGWKGSMEEKAAKAMIGDSTLDRIDKAAGDSRTPAVEAWVASVDEALAGFTKRLEKYGILPADGVRLLGQMIAEQIPGGMSRYDFERMVATILSRPEDTLAFETEVVRLWRKEKGLDSPKVSKVSVSVTDLRLSPPRPVLELWDSSFPSILGFQVPNPFNGGRQAISELLAKFIGTSVDKDDCEISINLIDREGQWTNCFAGPAFGGTEAKALILPSSMEIGNVLSILFRPVGWTAQKVEAKWRFERWAMGSSQKLRPFELPGMVDLSFRFLGWEKVEAPQETKPPPTRKFDWS